MKDQTTEQLTAKIVLEFAKTIELFDLTPLESRLFAYLYLTKDALTLDEMSEAIGKSKTSMSTSIRSLLDLNLVARVWKKGVRKDIYQANEHLFKTFMNSYINKWIVATSHQKSSFEEIKSNLDAVPHDKNSAFLTNRLTNIMEFHNNIEISFRHMKNN